MSWSLPVPQQTFFSGPTAAIECSKPQGRGWRRMQNTPGSIRHRWVAWLSTMRRGNSEDEQRSYDGPIHYIGHHEVLKPDSKSKPCRSLTRPPISRATCLTFIGSRVQTCSTISESCFDSGKCASQERYKISKDQPSRLPQTSILVEGHWDKPQASFGYRLAGTIATVALRKTARMEQDIYPIRKISDKSVLDLSLSSTVTIHWAYSGAVHVSPQTFWFQKLPIKI